MSEMGNVLATSQTANQDTPKRSKNSEDDRIQKILRRHEQMKREKQPWLATYQICGEYIFLRRQDFTRILAPGQFLTGRIFDGTAPRVLHQMASALIGALWPGGEKVFVYKPPHNMDDKSKQSDEVKTYYRKASEIAYNAIRNPRAGWHMCLEEYMNDQGAFGISGIGVFETDDPSMPVRFEAVDTKKLTIDEGENGFVDTVYIEKQMTVRQVVQTYGLQNVSPRTREKYINGTAQGIMGDFVRVLHAIEPRMDAAVWQFGNASYPVASIHIEIEQKHVLKESGYYEMPVFVTRFYKAMSEKYGRSPGMEAMPDVLEINALREAEIIAVEKILNPPIAVTQDGAAGGGTINTSAGAINVRTLNGRISDAAARWIEPIITVGDIKPVLQRILEIEQNINNMFLLDRLTDLNNETRMTLGEVHTRERLRGQTLGTVLSRQVAELFTPLVQRVFNILLGKGMLGYPPTATAEIAKARQAGEDPLIIPMAVFQLMVKGHNVYDVEYLTPAARIMRAEELMGIQQTATFVENLAKAGLPQVVDNIDMDRMVERVVELTGAPSDIVMSLEAMQKIRTARQQAQQAQVQTEQGHIQAQTSRGYGQAMQAAAKAGVSPLAMVPQQQGQGAA